MSRKWSPSSASSDVGGEEEEEKEKEKEKEKREWEDALRKMLPAGASIPGEDELDYSFALEYQGPPVSYKLPKVEPLLSNSIPSAVPLSHPVPLPLSLPLSLPVIPPLLQSTPSRDLRNKDEKLSSDEMVDTQPQSQEVRSLFKKLQTEKVHPHSENGDVSKKPLPNPGDIQKNGIVSSENEKEPEPEPEPSYTNHDALNTKQEDLSKALLKMKGICDSGHLLNSTLPTEEAEFSESTVHGESAGTSQFHSRQLGSLSNSPKSSCSDAEEASQQSFGSPPQYYNNSVGANHGNNKNLISSSISQSTEEIDMMAPSASAKKKRKKGMCDRCQKVSRLKEKEACLVCNAKYCSSCVLRAMGSMPEGRKCVTCIGLPIDEYKRSNLGKCSRMLSNILSPLEVQQIMKAEKECAANQLQPEYVIVNGRQLWPEEMADLLGCPNPPHKLKPGKYWYDKVIGFWGKEGHKPSEIITPNLNIGGELQQDASDGNTKVFINGREITKIEFKMLKMAGVQCAGEPHYWVEADGSYQEEGHNNPKGNIWGKASTRVLCALLSLPTPRKSANGVAEDPNNRSSRLPPEYLEPKNVKKLLLLGYQGSGSSTIFNQARLVYGGEKFSEEELQNIKLLIQSNLFRYISILLEGRERFEEENLLKDQSYAAQDSLKTPGNNGQNLDSKSIFSINQRLKMFSDWLLRIVAMGEFDTYFPAATREYAPLVEELWRDPAIQATYRRRNELHMLPEVASYFLNRVMEIASNEYKPSDTDIIYAGGVPESTGLSSCEFSINNSSHTEPYHDDPDCHGLPLRYQLIKVNAVGLSESYKWLNMFEDVRAVIFCVSLSDYNQMWTDEKGVLRNKMLLSKELFENVVKHPCFKNTPFVLLLTKFDDFEDKIANIPLTACDWFKDFNPVKAHNNNSSLVYQAYYYVAMRFKSLFMSLRQRKLSVWQVKAWDHDSVEESFTFIKEVLKWDEEKDYYFVAEESFYTDTSSYSPNVIRED